MVPIDTLAVSLYLPLYLNTISLLRGLLENHFIGTAKTLQNV